MSLSCTEKLGSRRIVSSDESASMRTIWNVFGTNDESEARQKLLDTAFPIYYDSVKNRTLYQGEHEVDQIGDELWECSVEYATPKAGGDGEENEPPPVPSFSFDTTGGTTHVTQSKVQTRYPAAAPDLHNCINFQEGGEVEGVDIVIPAIKFSETHHIKFNKLTQAYVNTLTNLTGKTNAATWRQFAPGCVLFLGASGSSDDKGYVPVTYSFEASPLIQGLQIDGIAGIVKRGFDYLWVRYRNDVVAGQPIKRAAGVYVEQVYDSGDFGALGI